MIYQVLKRLLDIVGSLIALVLFSPIIIFTAIYIRIKSPGGPIFADIPLRVGKNGKEFRFLKFRSMIPGAHTWLEQHPDWMEKYKANNYKIDPKEDPRMIKDDYINFMRKTSIDELPQFINVLQGEMSIVGPRAYYPFEIKDQAVKFNIPAEVIAKVISVNPGITGPWQVGGRSLISFDKRIALDADYAGKKSILYDILLILKTPYAVLSMKGAY
ncbi:multidrug MFS transporter [candidate division WWE3 bacterium CG08_land_8_20_14_0_20_41_10]|uniref:Multidrug MFS transporter n=1 Tax=candidate division WWE3 bacterium CG08_land_8_20_14_0_20_41_10 TaxID=1975085 RepID=A0A2H0XB94_UNCKA|nr:MAG: multidrug MFS transporter [candidate division WWE3 bacterium CG08_land_8_20_14_0_20_41_10]